MSLKTVTNLCIVFCVIISLNCHSANAAEHQHKEQACTNSYVNGTCVCELADESGNFIDLSELVNETAEIPMYGMDKFKTWHYYLSFCTPMKLPRYPNCHNISTVCQVSNANTQNDYGIPEKTRFEYRRGQYGDETRLALVTESVREKNRAVVFLICDESTTNATLIGEPWLADRDDDNYWLVFLNVSGPAFCARNPFATTTEKPTTTEEPITTTPVPVQYVAIRNFDSLIYSMAVLYIMMGVLVTIIGLKFIFKVCSGGYVICGAKELNRQQEKRNAIPLQHVLSTPL